MAKKVKEVVVEEVKEIEPTVEVIEETAAEPIAEELEIPTIYIPDIPAQMIETKTSEHETPTVETEIDFLQRILNIQENGGFGRHLNGIIYERIKSLS